MNALHWLFTRTFTYISLALAILAIYVIGYDMGKLFLWFILPFYGISLLFQLLAPKIKAPLEKNELVTDIISNTVTIGVVNSIQTWGVGIIFALSSSSLLIHFGIMDAKYGLADLPHWLQIVLGLLIMDFFFYVTHRIAHEVPFFWRFHAIHHCAHRVTFMNAYRVHPIDAMFRRYVPLFFVMLTGISNEAFVASAVIGSVLATVTHLNIDLRHGWFNYLIATNENHRWHHSTNISEAKNFSVITVWDHLFGTFYLPRDRDMPEKTGLVDETDYPLHNYWQLLLQPFRKKKADNAPVKTSELMNEDEALSPSQPHLQ
ncbi:MAG: sterol desaturase family protein [Oleibacter sp.]|nr:sterol desaturase family protein [Thalassolituus sp.]